MTGRHAPHHLGLLTGLAICALVFTGSLGVERTALAQEADAGEEARRQIDHACMLAAKNQDEVMACIEGKKSHGCGACLTAPAPPPPLALVLLPLVAIARRARRRR